MRESEGEGPILLSGALARYSGGDRDFEREALALFLETARALVDTMQAGSGSDLKRAVHTLKGNSRSVGALRLCRAAEDVEDELGRPDGQAAVAVEEVVRRFEELLDYLEDTGQL